MFPNLAFQHGTKRPNPRCGRDIQSREAGGSKTAGKRKRQHMESHLVREEEASQNSSSGGEYEDDAEERSNDE
ncbi:LOW QUALITY PROTEIN: Hypothetical protein PHPALM_6825 [Phytophthora palmivora]|uniref:Uncharacterized protein n=1 Tax=Phytophthora palmivora TaxID=4796 RepID=A0A2P4YDX5_9STRA|nr:LOW QUALITY PROTEIN: Hypothetical protein PHPALM_6825 [Phytophthora palmivora]